MKYTDKQIERSAKKLARVAGVWNCADLPPKTRAQIEVDLFKASMALIQKMGLVSEYEKSLREYSRFIRVPDLKEGK